MRLNHFVKSTFPGLVLVLVCLPIHTSAQTQASRAITLDPPTGLDLQAHTVRSNGEMLPPAPANFQRLGEARVGQLADLHTLTLRFSQTTKITGISVTKDFKVEQGGSCVEGNVYEKGSTCRLLVRFTPQGPGNRLGKLTVSHTGSVTPDDFGLGGIGYSPVISFIPSIIATVPGTFPSSTGLLSSAQNLAIDGGDVLYIADTGNSILRDIDSTGVINNVSEFFGIPQSIAVDSFGNVSEPQRHRVIVLLRSLQPGRTQTGWSGPAYTPGNCTASTPCNLISVGLGDAGEIGIDANDNLFMEEETKGALVMPVGGWVNTASTLDLWYLNDYYAYYLGPPSTFAVNGNGDLFTAISYSTENECSIVEEPLYGAEGSNPTYTRVAGAIDCGYSGDGGLAADAEIGSAIGQMAFDAAGDLYFTDTKNQRVRRVNYNTGIIRTVAGNGTAGYTGDGIGGPGAELASPTGVGVDSQGQIYIISGAAATGTAQVIRQVTTVGYRNYGNVTKGTKGTSTPIIVTNTGNAPLQIVNTSFTGPNASEFAIDPTITTCVLTPGSNLQSGQTCQIGFTATPAAVGQRTAYFNLLDNSVAGVNVVDLYVTGKLPAATFKITSPSSGASYASGTAVPFKVTVTSASGPAPTGTVQFKVDGANFGSPVTLASGAASTSVTGLTVTSHTLSATYSGDTNYAAGGAISVSITVTGTVPPPAVTLVPMMSTATTCGPLSFEVAVTGKAGSVPTGAIQLMNGQSQVAFGTLAGGKAVLTAPPLHPGTYAFTAHYGGDAHNQPAVSPALTQTVSQLGGCLARADSSR